MSQLSKFIKHHEIKVALIDAAGVLYNTDGPIPSARPWLDKAQCQVVLATNNTYCHIQDIQDRLSQQGIQLPKDHIISSGLGLADLPEIKAHIQDQHVYVFGSKMSEEYILRANPKSITQTLDKADVIVLSSTLKSDHESRFSEVCNHLKQYPQTPVICSNPDQIIASNQGKKTVIGSTAKQLETMGHPVTWVGKPYPNFSQVVKQHCLKLGYEPGPQMCFIDDNPFNLQQLCQDLNLKSILITDTGIATHLSHCPFTPDLAIPALGH